MSRTVMCTKLGREAPGLGKPPFNDDLGKEIYENVSEEGWKMWRDDMMIKIINEYRLNLADPANYQTLIEQMRAFLNLGPVAQQGQNVLEVENPDRGRKG